MARRFWKLRRNSPAATKAMNARLTSQIMSTLLVRCELAPPAAVRPPCFRMSFRLARSKCCAQREQNREAENSAANREFKDDRHARRRHQESQGAAHPRNQGQTDQ